MGTRDSRPQVLPALVRVLCLMVVAVVGLAGTVAWAPRTMLGGPPHSSAHKSSEKGPFGSTPPITAEEAEEAAEAALNDKVDGARGAGSRVLGIPSPLLAAYRRAATTLGRTDPGCHLQWWILAGIGKVESNHARGGRVDAKGRTNGEILGPRLDGSLANTAVIRDSDDGRLDRDTAYDRAVGPMQFLPSTWRTWATDGNDDGVRDPHNIYDSTLAAGRYLCAGSADLSTPSGLSRAILRYNPSGAYLRSVLGWAASYRDGGHSVPAQTGPVGSGPEPPRRGSVPNVPGLPGPIRDLPSSDPPSSTSPGSSTPPPQDPSPQETPKPGPSGPEPTPPPDDPDPPKPPNDPDPPQEPDPQPPEDPKPTEDPDPTPTNSTPTPIPSPEPTDPSPTPTDPSPTCPEPTDGPTPTPSPTPEPTPTGTPTPSPTCPEPEPTNASPTPSPAPEPA